MKAIGIDLGLHNSVVAVCDPQPRVLENREIKPETRSIVGLKKRKGKDKDRESEILVGERAIDNWPLAPKDTIVSVKRLMGRVVSDPEVEKMQRWALYSIVAPSDGSKDSVRVVMGGKEYSPIDISAMILKKLKEDAEFRLNDEVTHAVITVPAYFNQSQRAATREAGIQAGLKVTGLLDEPTAAAISYGIDAGNGTPKMLLVYDLGGDAFDISVLMRSGNAFAPICVQGDVRLGGDKFDQVLVDHVIKYVKEEYDIDPTSNMRFMAELKTAAEKAKKSLDPNRKVDLVVAGVLQDSSGELVDIEIEITREYYERMIRGLVDQTVTLTKKALADCKITPDEIDSVLMAGGSTCTPLVQQAMEELFGVNKVMRKVHPKYCAAFGAAIVADRIGTKNVCSSSLGGRDCGHVNDESALRCSDCGATLDYRIDDCRAISDSWGAPFNYGITLDTGDHFVFVQKGEPYPTVSPRYADLFTLEYNQRVICIPIYGSDSAYLADGELQGHGCVMLPPRLPLKSTVTLRLSLDADGIFEVAAELIDGARLPAWIDAGLPRMEDGVGLRDPSYWRAQGVAAVAKFVLYKCAWMLGDEGESDYRAAARHDAVVADICKAAAHEDAVVSFGAAVDGSEYLSKCVWIQVARSAIDHLVRPDSPVTAAHLFSRTIEVECLFRGERRSAQTELKALIYELAECASILHFQRGEAQPQ